MIRKWKRSRKRIKLFTMRRTGWIHTHTHADRPFSFSLKKSCRQACRTTLTPAISNRSVLFVSLESRCRSSAVDLQNPHCPICQISLSSQEMLAHIQQELDILERTTRQMSKSSARHSHPANGHQKVSSHLQFLTSWIDHYARCLSQRTHQFSSSSRLDSPGKYN